MNTCVLCDTDGGLLLHRARPAERDTLIASIGPFWDANETWLVLGVGILLVAFPKAHGLVLTQLYLPVALMLLGLILRGVAFDFRVKARSARKPMWDRLFFSGSLVASLSQGRMLGRYISGFGDGGWNYPVFAAAIALALPAAYAFSRYSFLGDKHVFFWLLTNRMTPPAVFLLPFFQLYTTVGLMDTHIAVALAHLLFNVPLAVWILEGFMSGIPREIDETAYIDGYSFPRFFITIFLPLIKAGVGVAAFFCFMFSWVELLMARTLTSVNAKPIVATMTRTVSASGMDWATLAAAGVLTIVPGAIVIWFVRHYIAKGFAMGRV